MENQTWKKLIILFISKIFRTLKYEKINYCRIKIFEFWRYQIQVFIIDLKRYYKKNFIIINSTKIENITD